MEHTLYFLPTDMDLPPKTVDALLARVSPARRAKIAALRRAADARNALLAAVAVRLCAAEALGAENGQLQFACTVAGKPYLIGAPDFCFSLSHTDGAVALAVSPIAVGADIERLREAPRDAAKVSASGTPLRLASASLRVQISKKCASFAQMTLCSPSPRMLPPLFRFAA